MRTCFTATHNTAEGGAAAALTAVLQERAAVAGRRSVGAGAQASVMAIDSVPARLQHIFH